MTIHSSNALHVKFLYFLPSFLQIESKNGLFEFAISIDFI
jgi:hypothetical protein